MKGGEEIKMKTAHKGFTLVELLVVIAIIAILAAVVVLIVNPLEITKQSRDAARLSDLASLQQAMNVATQESNFYVCGVDGLGAANTGYCTGKSSAASATQSDGTGWVKADLSTQKNVSVPNLPLDPTNDDTTSLVYTYCADAGTALVPAHDWEINAKLESDKYANASDDTKNKMVNDGGDADGFYEVGSKLTLYATSGGVCAN